MFDAAAREHWLVTGGDQGKLNKVSDTGAEPTFNEYYEHSNPEQEYELMFMAAGLTLTGWAAFKFLYIAQ